MIDIIPYSSREEWLAIRRKHNDVTASEIAAIMGLHKYKTAMQVYFDKIGKGEEAPDNPSMRRGRILEPAVAEAVREERPHWNIWKSNYYYRDSELRIGATPDWCFNGDGVVGDGFLETKTANPNVFERDWCDGPPIAYVLQTLTQMMLAGAEQGAIACMVTSQDFPVHIYDVPRNARVEEVIRKAVEAFWRKVEMRSPPPPGAAEETASLFTRESKPVLDLTGDNMLPGLLEDRAEIIRIIAANETRKEEIDAEIKQRLGEHEGATLPGWKITWKTHFRKETITPAREVRMLRVARTKEIA